MANLSDACGTVKVHKVGKAFLEYARVAAKNYYNLVGAPEDLKDLEVNKDGDIEFTFETFGRWAFSRNLEEYLDPSGTWHLRGEENEAYKKLEYEIARLGGKITIEYTDGEQDWSGKGIATLESTVDKVVFDRHFKED